MKILLYRLDTTTLITTEHVIPAKAAIQENSPACPCLPAGGVGRGLRVKPELTNRQRFRYARVPWEYLPYLLYGFLSICDRGSFYPYGSKTSKSRYLK
jgi:hypothetical protein